MKPYSALDVVIVNHNSGDVLAECLKTLNSQPSPEINTWVVDNASVDQSLAPLSKFDQVQLLKNTTNVGFAQACNQGAAQGHAEVLAFVNPDCFIQAQQLQQLAACLQQDTVLVGCRVLNQDGSLQRASRRRLPTFWRVLCHVTGLSRLPGFSGINIQEKIKAEHPFTVEAVNGACFVVSRAAFAAIGGFDGDFPLHFEDLDLFRRLQKNQGQLMYHPGVEVTHIQGHSEQQAAVIKTWKKQGLRRYFRKHRPGWEHALIKVLSYPG